MGKPTPQTQKLALEKLESSGLSPRQISATTVEASDMAAMGFAPHPALKIVYLHPLTKEPLRPRPGWPDFVRYRYLVDVPNGTGKRPIRYTQPANTGVCAFFPHTVDWQKVFDSDTTIYITEGELKAAKAATIGLPCIGLGGVWNFLGNATATGFLPELREINWVRRKVVIIYDSDARTKADVCKAINALASHLEMRGAIPYTLILPELQAGSKTGLDDYLITHPNPTEFQSFCEVNKQSLTLAQPLWELNDRVALIRDPGLVVDTVTGQLLSTKLFSDVYSSQQVEERVVSPGGDVSLKLRPLAARWLQWPMRREHQRLSYLPGQPTTPEVFNTWRGFKSTPVKGDVTPFLRLIDHLFYTTAKEDRD